VLSAALAAMLAVVLANLSPFDERLRPEIEALRHPLPLTSDDNGYAYALGFQVADGRDPRAAGNQVIAELRARRSRREAAVLDEQEISCSGMRRSTSITSRRSSRCGCAPGSVRGNISRARHSNPCATREHRNPYTGEAMEYDPIAGTLGFACLHTAFHPPEPADQCAVALVPSASSQ
jgi:hypothetical protein